MHEFYSDYQNSIRGKWDGNYSLGEKGGGGLDVKTLAWMFSYIYKFLKILRRQTTY